MPNISQRATGQYDVQYTAEDYMELQERRIKQLMQERDELRTQLEAARSRIDYLGERAGL